MARWGADGAGGDGEPRSSGARTKGVAPWELMPTAGSSAGMTPSDDSSPLGGGHGGNDGEEARSSFGSSSLEVRPHTGLERGGERGEEPPSMATGQRQSGLAGGGGCGGGGGGGVEKRGHREGPRKERWGEAMPISASSSLLGARIASRGRLSQGPVAASRGRSSSTPTMLGEARGRAGMARERSRDARKAAVARPVGRGRDGPTSLGSLTLAAVTAERERPRASLTTLSAQAEHASRRAAAFEHSVAAAPCMLNSLIAIENA